MSKTNTYKRWTAEEVEMLHRLYPTTPAESIAFALGRTADSVWEKAVREGLAKRPRKKTD